MNIMIVGAGFTGIQLARRLINEKNTVTLIDNDADVVFDLLLNQLTYWYYDTTIEDICQELSANFFIFSLSYCRPAVHMI